MTYPKPVMKAGEMAELFGMSSQTFADMLHLPGQKFAWKMSAAKNSPVLFDTEEFEKWRKRQIVIQRG